MSEFASMLDSFKKNAAAETNAFSSSSSSTHPSRRATHSTNNNSNNNNEGGRRPHDPPARTRHQYPSFPQYHHDVRNKRSSSSSSSFELSFLVIGAQKAGTTWLHSMLRKCRRISLPRHAKELHFWDWYHRKGYDWYVDQFDHRRACSSSAGESAGGGGNAMAAGGEERDDDECEVDNGRRIRRLRQRPKLYGEITPCYVALPPCTIAEIGRCHPDVKLVFIARDLVDRAWSAMIMELRDRTMGMKPGEFANGVVDDYDNDIDENDDCERRGRKRARGRLGDDDVATLSSSQRRRMQRQSSPSSQSDEYFLERMRDEVHTSRSDYASHLRRWYDHFPTENVLLVNYRDIEVDPRGVLRMISSHVGLDDDEADAYVSSLGEEDLRRRVNAASSIEPGGDAAGHDRQRALLSQRPNLERKMREYLLPYARDFNMLLAERGHSWRLNE